MWARGGLQQQRRLGENDDIVTDFPNFSKLIREDCAVDLDRKCAPVLGIL